MLLRLLVRDTVFALATACCAMLPAHAGSPAPAAPAALTAGIEAALERAGLPRDAMVALVQEIGTSRTRLSWQPEQPVNPASLMKLLTTFAGLDLLGPAWTWSTPLWLHGSVRDGVLDGDLVIRGSGDPNLVIERIWLMLKRVRQLGVRDIGGDIVLDRNAFAVPAESPGDFDGEALRPYNVGADALMLNFKTLALTITPDVANGVARLAVDPPLAGMQLDASVPLESGPCTNWRGALRADFSDPLRLRFAGAFPISCGVKMWATAYADPGRYNARALLGLWQDMGGRLGGTVRDGSAPASLPSLEIASPALAEIVRDINKYSNNVMAQQLFLTLGLTQRGSGTPDAAREVLHQWAIERFGAQATAGLVIDNGSGLSRQTRVSADLLTRLLQAAWASPVMPELMSSLPVSGVDGTLRQSGPAPARAHLKTGSLTGVAGVAGYVLADSGRRYVVVAIVNHARAHAARAVFDTMLRWTADDAGDDAMLNNRPHRNRNGTAP